MQLNYPTLTSLLDLVQMRSGSLNKIRKYQERQLRRVVVHAWKNTVYYHDLFESLGLKPDAICSLVDLRKIPPTNKEDIRKAGLSALLDRSTNQGS
ncbi:MAG: hypothetical protein ACWGQW_14350, partial [bacterium]